MTHESLVDWAAHWVWDSPLGQRQRFVDALKAELADWTPPTPEPEEPAPETVR